MNRRQPRDMAASVRQRLYNLSKERREDFGGILARYASERLLYRLSLSAHAGRFVLKGATLFNVWSGEPHRATRDLDLLGVGMSAVADLEEVFRDVCQVSAEEDGIVFLPESVSGRLIRGGQEYEGVRIAIEARPGQARIRLQIDIGFGDAVVPGPEEIVYPTLLDFSPPRLRSYPREVVVAEKYQAMVVLGIANTRMKDFYDLWVLSNQFGFEGVRLCSAIRATFGRRRTSLPVEPPLALTPSFGEDATRRVQWEAFIRRGRLEVPIEGTLGGVIRRLSDFLLPRTTAIASGQPFEFIWLPAGPWTAHTTG